MVVHFRNELPEPSTVHWHGLTLPFEADGSPFHPVPPNGQHDYVFTVRPGTAGTYWYHPHPDHRTGHQVAKGLCGALVVRADDDPLPASLPERLLVLSDNRFGPAGVIDLPAAHSPASRIDAENGREGDVLFVSGAVMPTFTIRSGEVQRWRVSTRPPPACIASRSPDTGSSMSGATAACSSIRWRSVRSCSASANVPSCWSAVPEPPARGPCRRRCRTTATSHRRALTTGTLRVIY